MCPIKVPRDAQDNLIVYAAKVGPIGEGEAVDMILEIARVLNDEALADVTETLDHWVRSKS